MKFIGWLLLIFIFVSANSVTYALDKTKAVNVTIDLEENAFADHYEIEIKQKNKKNAKQEKTQSFLQTTAHFNIKLLVGYYEMRSRFVAEEQKGPWSEWQELLAPPEEVQLEPQSKSFFAISKIKPDADLLIRWQSKQKTKESYKIFIENVLTHQIIEKTTSNPSLNLKLTQGEYRVGVQTVTQDNLRSPIVYFTQNFIVSFTKLPLINIKSISLQKYSWNKLDQYDHYQALVEVFYKPFFGTEFKKISSEKLNQQEWSLNSKLIPGEYKINFSYISDVFENGPVLTKEFIIKPEESLFK